MRVLIIEDNPDIAANVGDYLEINGHWVDFASDGVMGLNLAREHAYDVLVLDINLPRMNGFDVCRQLTRELKIKAPVLMLTARGDLQDKVEGFEVGALDYLVKPFELQELELRLQSLVRRGDSHQSRLLEVGELRLNLDTLVLRRADKELQLHQASMKLLAHLMTKYPKVASRQDLEYLLWKGDPPDSDPLRSHMYEIRNVIDRDFSFKMLKTVRGVGFVLRTEGL